MRNPRIVAADALETVDQLARGLDTRKTAADDDKVAKSPPQSRVGFQLDSRDAAEHDIADMHRVADRLQRQRVLGRAGNQVQARATAEREHQMLVGDPRLARKRRAGEDFRGGIDGRDPAHDEAPPR